jgi:uncharacterized protein (DUF2267 family)
MTYKEMVKKVSDYSGFSDSEAERALRCIVEKLATRLTTDERYDFAAQLPTELQEVAEIEDDTPTTTGQEMIQEICAEEDIDEKHAKKQLHAVWLTLEDSISPGEIEDIKAQLPNDLVATLR